MSSSDPSPAVTRTAMREAFSGGAIAGERARLEKIISDLRLDEFAEYYEKSYNDALDDVLRYIRPRTP